MKNKLSILWQRVMLSGFIHVFSASAISYLVAFCGSIIYVRLMGIHDFGVYTFAYNIITIFLLVNGFGAASGILQFVSSSVNYEEQLSYLKYSFKLGFSFNCLMSVGIIIYTFIVEMPITGSDKLLLCMAFFPIGRFYIDVFQAFLRATHNNNVLAKFVIGSNLTILLFNVLGIYLYGLYGFVISTYISYVVIILIATYIYRLPNILTIIQGNIQKSQFIKYSIYAVIGNAFSGLLFILDIFLLAYIIKDASIVAAYKVATVIPFALNFIPGVVSTFFYPYFAKNQANIPYIRKLRKRLQYSMLAFSLPVSLTLLIIAKPLIFFIFGSQYEQSILPFQILVFGFWIIATFRIISGNILSSLGKAKIAMWLNIIVMSINIILTYFLIKYFGIIGAALGVVAIYILAGLIANLTLNQVISRKL